MSGKRGDLIRYRLEQAAESLESAQILLGHGMLRPTVNRAYYAMFYAVLALLASEGRGTSKHSGAMALFDRDFVRTGVVRRELSSWLHKVFDLRQDADYAELVEVTPEQARIALERAEAFLAEVRQVLSTPEEAGSGLGK